MQYYYHEQLTDLDESGFGLVHMTQPAAYTPPHWHRPVELFYFLTGKATIRIDGRADVLSPGALYLFNSYAIHESWFSPDASYLCVHIMPAQMCRFVSNFDRLQFSLGDDPDALSLLREQMKELLSLEQLQETGWMLRRQAIFYTIALTLVQRCARRIKGSDDAQQRSDMVRLEPLLDHTELHHAEELTLDGAAASMGLSKEYFCRLFKRNMGVSYLQYVNQVRAAAVYRELAVSDDPIGDICERHGVRNLKVFHALFRELYGCTPMEQRRRRRNASSPVKE